MKGTLVKIYTAPEAGAPMQAQREVRAVAGRGLEGDRYFYGEGTFSRWPGPHREVTLVAEEDLQAMARETGIALPPEESRRNLLVHGVSLRTLVRQEFHIGNVLLRGIRSCQPCKRLERLTGRDGLLRALVDRGGLRAQVLESGLLRPGLPIALASE